MTSPHRDDDPPHGVRPADLVALVAFDDHVYKNHAFARERLARPEDGPHPLGATIEQWLGLGRRTWIDMRGRQIEGIATARELGARVWLIDTLVDASDESMADGPQGVFAALLRKARDTAADERMTHLLLRTRVDGEAHRAALRCGFKQVLVEETWTGTLAAADLDATTLERFSVRRAGEQDDFRRFQLFNRVLPLVAREAIALTLDEWQSTRERRWLQRGGSEWVALDGNSVVGALQLRGGDHPELEMLTETRECAFALVEHARATLRRRGAGSVFAVAPAAAPGVGAALAAAGLARQDEFVVLSQRLAHPVAAEARVPRGLAVPTRG